MRRCLDLGAIRENQSVDVAARGQRELLDTSCVGRELGRIVDRLLSDSIWGRCRVLGGGGGRHKPGHRRARECTLARKSHVPHSLSARKLKRSGNAEATRVPVSKRLKSLEGTPFWSDVRVRFPDSICRAFGQLESVALELGVEQLPIDVQQSRRFGAITAGSRERTSDQKLLQVRHCCRQILIRPI